MARLERKYQKIFALLNDASQRFGNGQFGSGKLGTKNITNDIEELQLLSAYDNGWEDAVLVNSAGQPTLPPLPESQALDYIETYQLAYLFQEGIPEYNADTTYYENSIVKASGTYQLFGSLVDNNINNPTSDGTKWELLIDLGALGDSIGYDVGIASGEIPVLGAGGKLPFSVFPVGMTLQTLTTSKADTFTTTSTSFVDVTGLSQAITPNANTNKVLVRATVQVGSELNAGGTKVQLLRGATIIGVGTTVGSRTSAGGAGATNDNAMETVVIEVLDSPATLSSTTYKVQVTTGTASAAYVNRSFTDSNSAGYPRGYSSITVQEIVAS